MGDESIGGFYKGLGVLALVGMFAVLAVTWKSGHGLGWTEFAMAGLFALVVLALIRPSKFDTAVKTVADKLPFTKYEKPPEA